MNEFKLSWKILLILLVAVHIVIALGLAWNHINSEVIYSGGDSWHMLYYHQHAQGGHMYYPRGYDVHLTSDGYTPFASQIFGWVIRFIGNDIRWVRLTAALFSFGGMWLAAGIVFRLTGSRLFSWLAAGLCAGMDIRWIVEVGPNTMHVAFSLLGLYFLVRDMDVRKWSTPVLVALAFFASYWTKQTGIAYMAAAVFYLICKDVRKGALAFLICAVLSAATAAYFASLDDANFIWRVFKFNQNQPLKPGRLFDPILFPVLTGRFAVMTGAVVAGLLAMKWKWSEVLRPHYVFLGASALVGIFATLKYGSGLQQAWFFFAVLIINGLVFINQFMRENVWAPVAITGLLLVQTASLAEDFRTEIITEEDEQRYEMILDILATPGKEAYYINQGYLNLLVGKTVYGNAAQDCWVDKEYRPDSYPDNWRNFLAKDPFDIIILDVPLCDGSFVLVDRINKAYRVWKEIPPDSRNINRGELRRKKVVFVKKTDADL